MRRVLNMLSLFMALLVPAVLFFFFITPSYAATDVTLQWNANEEPDFVGYRLYYKTGSSGNLVLDDYDGSGLIYVGDPYDGQDVDSGFEIIKDELPDPCAEVVTCSLSGLNGGVTYFFLVTAYDTEGLESKASNEVVITYDKTAPTSNATAPEYGNAALSITWEASDTTSGVASTQLWYKKSSGGTWSNTGLASQTGTNGIFSYTPPDGDGTYYFATRSTDNAGNREAEPSGNGDDSTVYDTIPPTAPTVSGITPTNDTTPTWSWSSGGGGNGTYRYKLDNRNLSSGATQTTNTTYTPGSALSEGSHTLYVQERDGTGNWSSSGSFSIVIDVTEPSDPVITTDGGNGPGSDYSTTDSSIILAVSCAADTVAIYVNGSSDGVTYTGVTYTPDETSWSYTGTLESGENTFNIIAYDAAGNVSDAGSITITNNFRPNKPDLYLPSDGEIDVSLTAELKTGDFSDPDTDDTHAKTEWQISKEIDFLSLLLDITSTSHLTSLIVPQSILDEGINYYWRVRFYDDNLAASDWSEPHVFTTLSTSNDTDANGIPDDQEVDSTVDLDGDGIPDLDQPDVIKSVETAVGNGMIGVSLKDSTNVSSIESLKSIDPDTIFDNTNKPEDFPLGIISFKLNVGSVGDTAEVSLHFLGVTEEAEENLEDFLEMARWYKYDSINGWQDYSAHVTFDVDGRLVTLQLKDGDNGDGDGTANGIIVDPSGLGTGQTIPKPSPTPAPSGGGGDGGGCFIDTAAF